MAVKSQLSICVRVCARALFQSEIHLCKLFVYYVYREREGERCFYWGFCFCVCFLCLLAYWSFYHEMRLVDIVRSMPRLSRSFSLLIPLSHSLLFFSLIFFPSHSLSLSLFYFVNSFFLTLSHPLSFSLAFSFSIFLSLILYLSGFFFLLFVFILQHKTRLNHPHM